MNKKRLLLFLFCTLAITTQAQLETWMQRFYSSNFNPNPEPYGHLLEKTNSILVVHGQAIKEFSYHGEVIHDIDLPDYSTIQGKDDYYFFDQLNINGTDFILAAQREGIEGGTHLSITYMDGTVGDGNIYLNDNSSNDAIIGHAGIKTTDGDYVFFGASQIYKVKVEPDNQLTIVWSKPKSGGPVSNVKLDGNGYITCSELGFLEKYNATGDLIWSKELGFPIFDVAVINNGYIICGGIEMTLLKKTDSTGGIIWSKDYGEYGAYSVLQTDDGGYLLGGKATTLPTGYLLIKTDAQGNEVWKRINGNGIGVQLQESRYGGYLLLTKFFVGNLVYLGDEGIFEHSYFGKLKRFLDINNIKTLVNPNGVLFNDNEGGYQLQNSNLISTIGYAGLWIAGKKINGDIILDAIPDQQYEFIPGPIDITNNQEYWNRIWEVNRREVEAIVSDLSDGIQELPIPLSILWWPAIGNPNIKYSDSQVIIAQAYAPFEDVNNDGIYNIYDGDYPIVSGDEMLWWIMNDNIEDVGNTGILEIEVSGKLYAYECGDDIIGNTTFLELSIVNKSTETYSDVYAGLLTNFDLGCYQDDLIGTLPAFNSSYAYNKDTMDGFTDNYCFNGYPSFETSIPIQSITFLNQHLVSSMTFYNGAVGFGGPFTFPTTNQQHYNFMSSHTRDGVPLTYGGSGYNPDSTNFVNHIYSGNPNDTTEWSMCTDGLNFSDGNSLNTMKLETFAPNQTLNLHFGLLTSWNIEHPCPEITPVENNINTLQTIYDDLISTGAYIGYALNLGPDGSVAPGEILDAGTGAVSYEWSTGETTPTIIPPTEGEYSVTVTTLLDCVQVDTIIVAEPVGVSSLLQSPLHVYPNPSNGGFFVDFGTEIPTHMDLINLQGQSIQQFSTSNFNSNSTTNLEMIGTTAGFYFLRCRYADGGISVQKLLLIR